MKEKVSKQRSKNATRFCSVRIPLEAKDRASKFVEIANKKNFGKDVKIHEVLSIAVGLITEKEIKVLQSQSLRQQDREEQLRQKYIELNGPISKNEFKSFMVTPAYAEFLITNLPIIEATTVGLN